MNRERFDELLDRWAEGGLTPAEAREFESLLVANPQWRSEADAHAAFLHLVRSCPAPVAPRHLLETSLRRAREMDRPLGPSPEARILTIPPAVATNRVRHRRDLLKMIYGTAAALALLVAGGWFVFDYATHAEPKELALVHDPSGHGVPQREAIPAEAPSEVALANEVETISGISVGGGYASPTAASEAQGMSLFSRAAGEPVAAGRAQAPSGAPRISVEEYQFLVAEAVSNHGRVAGGPEAAEQRTAFYVEFPNEQSMRAFAQRLKMADASTRWEYYDRRLSESEEKLEASDSITKERTLEAEAALDKSQFTAAKFVFDLDAYTSQVMRVQNTSLVRVTLKPLATPASASPLPATSTPAEN